MLQNEAEKTIKRIQAQKGVEGVIVVNAEGVWQMKMFLVVIIIVWLQTMSCASVVTWNWSVKEIFVISVCFLIGIPIESNLDHQRTLHYTYNFQQLLARTQRVMKDLDPQNEATLLDVQTEKNNILISTGKEKYTYVMLVFIRLGFVSQQFAAPNEPEEYCIGQWRNLWVKGWEPLD